MKEVLKKYISFLSCVCLLAWHLPAQAEAPSLPVERQQFMPAPKPTSTDNSYDRFCHRDAEDILSNLHEANNEKYEYIDRLQKRIDWLSKRAVALAQLKNIKRNYERSLARVSTEAEVEVEGSRLKYEAHIDNLKNIVMSATILTTINALMNETPITGNPTPDMTLKTLCATEKNKSLPICAVNDTFLNKIAQVVKGSAQDQADSAIAQMTELFNTAPKNEDKEYLKQEINGIVNSFPKEYSPEVILGTLELKAPFLYKALISGSTRETLLLCLEKEKTAESQDACHEFIADNNLTSPLSMVSELEISSFGKSLHPLKKAISEASFHAKDLTTSKINEVANFIEQDVYGTSKSQERVTRKARELKQSQQQNLRATIGTIAPTLSTNLNLNYESMYNSVPSPLASVETSAVLPQINFLETAYQSKEIKLDGMDWLFYNRATLAVNGSGDMQLLGSDAFIDPFSKYTTTPILSSVPASQAENFIQESIEDAKEKSTLFKNVCTSQSDDKPLNEETTKMCDDLADEIIRKVDVLQASNREEIEKLEAAILRLNDDTDFTGIEGLKKFVTEKYLCSCVKDKSNLKNTLISSDNQNCAEINHAANLDHYKIEGLNSSIAKIIGQTRYAEEVNFATNQCNQLITNAEEKKQLESSCSNLLEKNGNRSQQKYLKIACDMVSVQITSNGGANNGKSNQENAHDEYIRKVIQSYDNNYVDRTRDGRLIRTEKKSAFSLAGHALPTLAGRLIPAWLGNQVTKQNISMLTTQGIYQKQLAHTNSFYSNPWALPNAGFIFSGYTYSNPFTSTSSSNIGSSQGFNFTP